MHHSVFPVVPREGKDPTSHVDGVQLAARSAVQAVVRGPAPTAERYRAGAKAEGAVREGAVKRAP